MRVSFDEFMSKGNVGLVIDSLGVIEELVLICVGEGIVFVIIFGL